MWIYLSCIFWIPSGVSVCLGVCVYEWGIVSNMFRKAMSAPMSGAAVVMCDRDVLQAAQPLGTLLNQKKSPKRSSQAWQRQAGVWGYEPLCWERLCGVVELVTSQVPTGMPCI